MSIPEHSLERIAHALERAADLFERLEQREQEGYSYSDTYVEDLEKRLDEMARKYEPERLVSDSVDVDEAEVTAHSELCSYCGREIKFAQPRVIGENSNVYHLGCDLKAKGTNDNDISPETP